MVLYLVQQYKRQILQVVRHRFHRHLYLDSTGRFLCRFRLHNNRYLFQPYRASHPHHRQYQQQDQVLVLRLHRNRLANRSAIHRRRNLQDSASWRWTSRLLPCLLNHRYQSHCLSHRIVMKFLKVDVHTPLSEVWMRNYNYYLGSKAYRQLGCLVLLDPSITLWMCFLTQAMRNDWKCRKPTTQHRSLNHQNSFLVHQSKSHPRCSPSCLLQGDCLRIRLMFAQDQQLAKWYRSRYHAPRIQRQCFHHSHRNRACRQQQCYCVIQDYFLRYRCVYLQLATWIGLWIQTPTIQCQCSHRCMRYNMYHQQSFWWQIGSMDSNLW